MVNRNTKRRREIVVRLRINKNDGEIKKSLGRIEHNQEEGRKFSFVSVMCAFLATMGFGLINFVLAKIVVKDPAGVSFVDKIMLDFGAFLIIVGGCALAGYIFFIGRQRKKWLKKKF